MKNLSAILRLSPSETFTILITLVVCLAGFIVAEVNPEYRKQYSNQIRENLPYSRDTSKVTGDELEGRSYNKLKNFPESSLDLVKRQLANIGESDEYDQKENYGYGYDDDDYYHLNFKRSDTENINNINNNNNNNNINTNSINSNNNRKLETDFGSSLKMKSDTNAKKFMNPAAKQKNNEFETIEMLNFKETHPASESENVGSNEDNRKYNKKNPATPSLKMSDFRENSAIDEKIKENKEESTLNRGSSQSKLAEPKKSEEKEPTKLKDSAEDSEKKEKEVSLKDEKEAVAPKPIKETSDEKDKTLKLSDTSKLEENDKLVGKSKAETKLKGGTEDAKVTSDMINAMDLSDKGNRASFVSSDYKDDSSKASAAEGEEKNSEESTGVASNSQLNQHRSGELERNREMLQNMYNNIESNSAFTRDIPIQMYQEPNKAAGVFSEYQNLNNDFFRKEDTRDPMMKYRFNLQPPGMPDQSSAIDQMQPPTNQMSPQTQEYLKEQERNFLQPDPMGQAPQDMNADNRIRNPYGLNLPTNMLENTEYHKNFLKSLKRYKSMSNDQKNFPENNSDQMGSLNLPYSNAPEQGETELKSEDKGAPQSKHSRRETANKGTSPQVCVSESQTSQGVSSDPTNADKGRRRRKSQKLEYEIKVINRSPHGERAEELSQGSRRFEKDLKSKSTERYLKKYPYSQVSRDDLVNLGNLNTEKKTKRKAPIRKRHDQKSLIQPRAVPNGYYGNRVKFGQKNFAKNNNERTENPDLTSFGQNAMPPPALSNQLSPSAADKSKMLRSWEARQQEFKHETMKRFDSSGSPNKGNSLFLVRKSDKVATTFDEENPQLANENTDSGNVAKMLSSNNNYVILSNPQNDQYQKLANSKAPNNVVYTGYAIPAYNSDNSQMQELKKGAKQPLKNRGLFARSSHAEKEERKVSSGLHSSKSNLKKTFEKFRDLAGFFKDNEQESSDNQYQAQELKEGRDIVFSEDKLPDPIVINSDGSEKYQGYTQKPLNSIYSISTNFKTLDQQDKKTDVPSGSEADKNMFTAEAKPDSLDSNWEPVLKNAFPEAKSINAMTKNGNEIIILDLNRNQLKSNHPFYGQMKSYARPMQYGTMAYMTQMPTATATNTAASNAGSRKIQVMIAPATQQQQISTNAKKNSFRMNPQVGKTYNMMQSVDTKSTTIEGLPALFRALMDTKAVTKRSLNYEPSENYNNILNELNELTDLSQKNVKKLKADGKRRVTDITYIPSSLSELSSYGNENIKSLENILQSIMAQGSGSNTYDTEDDDAKVHPELDMAYKTTWQVPDEGLDSLYLGTNKPSTNFFVGKTQERNNLWEGLSPAPGNRLRREETEKQKIQKEEVPESKSSVSNNANMCQAICSKTFPDLANTQSNEISDGENQEKSEYENQLNEFFESLYKNQKEPLNLPNESTWKRKKRKEIHSEKRSAGSGNKNKVSTTAEPNTIFKNLAEDNDQSVYSPGIKRRLFSTNNEADDADNNSDAINIHEHDKDVLVGEAERKCVKNSLNKCVDPMILEIFRNPQEKEKEETEEKEEKVRSRRSLNTGFHSNFKREIDLDESMPNDFQNFLVTSVGGFGSQTREALKKDDALWEGKANFQDGVSEPYEDSSLAKRDVSSMEKQKNSPYSKRFLSGDSNSQNLKNVMNSLQQSSEKSQTQKLSKNSEFREEKLPTQIRIQISNASAKEKKSSKPIMDESETTSTETENLPKEKEFLDKNKAGTVQEDVTKLRNPSKNRYGFSDYDESEDSTTYKSNMRKKKKKKFVPENPSKPAGDFLAFDQKAMESLLRRIISQQNMIPDQSTHRSPIASHLPQVETVYNPTQEGNKAQLSPAQLRKMIVGDSNGITGKTSLHEIGRTSLGEKDKLNPEIRKDEEVSGWPNFNNFNQDSSQNSIWDMPNINLNPTVDSFENGPPSFLFPYGQKRYHHKTPLPSSNYFCHASPDTGLSVENFYDALKIRQELKCKDEFNKQRHDALMARKNMRFGNENYMSVHNKAKSPDSILGYGSPWTNEYLSKPSIPPNIKNKFSRPFVREGKPPVIESLQQENGNNDYLDGFEDDYSEWLDPNEPLTKNNLQVEGLSVTEPGGKIAKSPFGAQAYQNSYFKSSDADDDDEEETEEDYGENLEDEDLDDFSVLANKDSLTSGLLKNHDRRKSYLDLLDGVSVSNLMAPHRNLKLWEKGYETSQMNSPRTEAKLIPESPEEDLKPDLGLSSGSSSLLRNANRKSNILKNNLIRNTYGVDVDHLDGFDRSWRIPVRNAIRQRGAFRYRRRDYPKIGNRVLYNTKPQFRNADPDFDFSRKQGRQSYRQNPLNAAFADPDNNFENESEENGKRFSDSLLTFGKNAQEDRKFGNENVELGDVTENLEDDGEAISEDNILENVIGKYIVRKRVASPADLSRANESPLRKEIMDRHKISKRGLEQFDENIPMAKILTKRLSSGHLTENNFRKYHKKNLSKIQAEVMDSASFDSPREDTPILMKRSALDIFKKITNKDRDNKKVENSECRSAGFEPLSSLSDKKYETQNTDTLSQLKKLISNENPNQYNSLQFKPFYPVGVSMGADQKRKEKVKPAEKTGITMQGPWKVELIDNLDKKKLEKPSRISESSAKLNNHNTILVFTSGVIAPEQNAVEELPSVSGSFQKEVGNSYGPKYDEVRGSSKMHFRKRSLDSSLSSTTHEDAAQTGHFAKIAVTLEEKNRALHDKRSLSAGDSKPETTHVLQRSAKKIRSFVNTDDKCQNAGFPSMGSLNKRKSVFLPSDNANILRDNGHINEETSKYLGQQIVDAIWSHVSESPKLKELIAPALAVRMTANKEDVGIRQKPMEHQQQQQDISDQLQYFLQKFMNDLERLAEKHVRKRMCNKIDAQSKQFLQTLLSAPLNPPQTNQFSKEKMCQCPNNYDKLWSEFNQNSEVSSDQEDYAESLSKKHSLLMKLIEDYRMLSDWEKESLGVNYEKLLQELYDVRSEMSQVDIPWNVSEQEYDPNCEAFNSNPVWCPVCKPIPKRPPPKDSTSGDMKDSAKWFPSDRRFTQGLRKIPGLFFDDAIMKHAKKQAAKIMHCNEREKNRDKQTILRANPQMPASCPTLLPASPPYLPGFPPVMPATPQEIQQMSQASQQPPECNQPPTTPEPSTCQTPPQDKPPVPPVVQEVFPPKPPGQDTSCKKPNPPPNGQKPPSVVQEAAPAHHKTSQATQKTSQAAQKTSQANQEMSQAPQKTSQASQKMSPYPQQMSPYPQQMYPYIQQMYRYTQQMSPYPQQMSPYPQQMSPYPQQMSPYPQQMSPYPQQMSPYPQQMSPYPQQMSPYPQQMYPYSQQMPQANQQKPKATQQKPQANQQKPQANQEKSQATQQKSQATQQKSQATQQKSQAAQQVPQATQQKSQATQQKSQAAQQVPQATQQMSQATHQIPPYTQQMLPYPQQMSQANQQMSQATQQMSQAAQQTRPDNPQMPYFQEKPQGPHQARPDNPQMMQPVPQMSPAPPKTLPTFVFEEEPSQNSISPQTKENSPFEVVEPSKITFHKKNENKIVIQREGVSAQLNQKQQQQQNHYYQNQQPIKNTFPMQPSAESFDLLPPQNFSENIPNFEQTGESKNSYESQSESTNTNSDTQNVYISSETKVEDPPLSQVPTDNSQKTLSSMPNSELNSEGKPKGEESPNKLTATLKKTRSTQDLQFHFGKNTFRIPSSEPLKPRYDGKKRIVFRSNDPHRFQKDKTSVTDAGISPSDHETQESPETDDTDDSELEYLSWSAMPAVRRQLNNLETGFEFDEFFSKIPKLKKA